MRHRHDYDHARSSRRRPPDHGARGARAPRRREPAARPVRERLRPP
jgi:hypothetical protein